MRSGGADNITVNDLTGTDVTQVRSISPRLGGTAGDGQPDQVIVNGTAGDDTITVADATASIIVNGPAAQVTIEHAEAANDRWSSTAGRQRHDRRRGAQRRPDQPARSTAATATTRSSAAQGNDLVNGGRGNDVALMGAGDDTFVWNPGDGSDTVEGQAGTDTLLFNGANVNENIDISANGERVRFSRDVGQRHHGPQQRRAHPVQCPGRRRQHPGRTI